MDASDLPLEFTDIRDESTPQRDGSFLRAKRYTFYLGKFGPFVERVPLEGFTDYEITRRVQLLRAHIQQAHG
jgi:hypothetical protein